MQPRKKNRHAAVLLTVLSLGYIKVEADSLKENIL